jgi:hypothetical protein
MPFKFVRTSAGTVLAACLLAVPAAADARVIGTANGKGRHASGLVAAAAHAPSRLYVRVSSSTPGRVRVRWEALCWKGDRSSSQRGRFTARTTVRRKLRKPMPNPDRCSVSAFARLDRSGRIKLQLLAV